MTTLRLTDRLLDGLTALPYSELVSSSASHMRRAGEWPAERLRPSVIATECPLSRVKGYFGHAPQPEATFDHARSGRPDGASNFVMARGAWLEGVVVAALDAAAVPVVLRSPTAVQADEWDDSRRWRYECHPDLIVGPQARPVQIKCPSDRALSYFLDGRQEMVLGRYGTQVLAELFIMELAGWEPDGATLLLVSAEPWPPGARRPSDPPIRAIEIDFAWGDQQREAIRARINETKELIRDAEQGRWPDPLPIRRAEQFPCSYCPYPRIPTGTLVPCEDNAAWGSVPQLRVVG